MNNRIKFLNDRIRELKADLKWYYNPLNTLSLDTHIMRTKPLKAELYSALTERKNLLKEKKLLKLKGQL